jgi:molybdate transport system substrate-binding protein
MTIRSLVAGASIGLISLIVGNAAQSAELKVLCANGMQTVVEGLAPKFENATGISSPEALKRALLAARSLTYLNPAEGGASGIHFAKVLDRLGIANDMKSKTVFAPKAAAVGAMVANGDAEIGVLQFQLLFSVPGIEIVGPLPGDLQATTVFSAAILSGAKEVEASRALITSLRTPEAALVIKAKGMEPGAP